MLNTEFTAPFVKKERMQRTNVTPSINLDNWSMPYLPYIKLENLFLKFITKLLSEQITIHNIQITNSKRQNQ